VIVAAYFVAVVAIVAVIIAVALFAWYGVPGKGRRKRPRRR